MKQPVRLILSGICLLALLAVGALAQTKEQEEAKKKLAADEYELKKKLADADEVEIKFRGEVFKMLGPKFGFETKFVKGAPYSATAEFETVQTLGDGNRIRSKSTTVVYRDSEGRTRRESVNKDGIATEVFISDPTTGINYSLYPQQRTAVNSQLNLLEVELKKKIAVNVQMKEKTRESGQIVQGEGMPIKKSKQSVMESLGKQVIEGVECEGKRTTITIPANSIGNDLPINIVSEEWYSPELQVLVLTKHSDPRNGETSYRLTNINRSQPDRMLFEVPADYTVRDNSMPPMKKKPLPEDER